MRSFSSKADTFFSNNDFFKIQLQARDIFRSCAKETLGITEITQPSFCYKVLPEANKVLDYVF
jgi:hypothetical protein